VSDNAKESKQVKKAQKHHFGKKWLIICVSAVIVLSVVFLCIYLYTPSVVNKSSDINKIDKVYEIDKSAQLLAKGGDMKAAIVLYDDAIDKATNNVEKRSIILSKAVAYFNSSQYDSALSAAKEAEIILKDSNVEQFMAQIYEMKGNRKSAAEYYQKAIELIDKAHPLADADAQYYLYKVKTLSGEAN